MNIFIDLRSLEGQYSAGVARYTVNVISQLRKKNYRVIGVCGKVPQCRPEYIEGVEVRTFGLMRVIPGSFFILLILPLFISKKDVFLGVNHCVPLWGAFKKVLFIHDYVYKLFPETQTFANRFLQRVSVELGLVSTKIVAFVSNYSFELFESVYPKLKATDEFVVLPNTVVVSESIVAVDFISKPFVFVLGSLEPRKNVAEIIRAFDIAREHFDMQLVVAGPSGWKNSEISETYENSLFKEDIHFVGYLTDEQVAWCYQQCEVFCFPSLYEGFGIPPFEALLSGAKVVGSCCSELRYYPFTNNLWIYHPEADDLSDLLTKALLAETKEPNIVLSSIDLSKIGL